MDMNKCLYEIRENVLSEDPELFEKGLREVKYILNGY
jgi:hypothetical protein